MILEKRDWLAMLRELDEPLPPREPYPSVQSFMTPVEGSPGTVRLDERAMLSALSRRAPGDHIGWEIPRNFERAAAQGRFDVLAQRLGEAFGVHLVAPTGPDQDAASFGTIDIPQEHTGARAKKRPDHRFPLAVVVSNFGHLAAYRHVRHSFRSVDDPDVPGTPEVHPDDGRRIDEILAVLGYVAVPEDVLDAPYDGPNATPESTMDWHTRFFGVL
jgi:hypothetical protein